VIYSDDNDTIQVGFFPTAMVVDINNRMGGRFSAIEEKSAWSDTSVDDRLAFAAAVTQFVTDHELGSGGDTNFLLIYGGNISMQATRAFMSITEDLTLRENFTEMLEQYPFIGAFGSPFGYASEPMDEVPSRDESDKEWAS
jgi:hypothetical protein